MNKLLEKLLHAVLLALLMLLPIGLSAQGIAPPTVPPSQLTLAEATRWARALPQGGQPTRNSVTRPRTVGAGRLAAQTGLPAADNRLKAAPSKPQAAPGTGREVWGNLLYSTEWEQTGQSKIGFYTFNVSADTELQPVVVNDEINASFGGAIYDGVFHGVYTAIINGYEIPYYAEYNIKDWSATARNGQYMWNYSLAATATAYDPVTKRVYGNYYTSDQSSLEFGYADYENLTHVRLGQAKSSVVAMAVLDGKLYAFATDGNLYQISTADGTTTLIGSTGVEPSPYFQGAVGDPRKGVIYWAASRADGVSALYVVDPATAKSEVAHLFENEESLVSLYLPDAPEDGAPERALDVKLNFPAGATTGSLDFEIPTVNFGGTALDGPVTYTATVGGNNRSGSVQPGEKVSLPFTLERGQVTAEVQLANSVGKSYKTTLKQWIGQDDPLPPNQVKMEVDDNHRVTLTWRPPSGGEHGGYVDYDNLTYDVVRQPGSVPVAAGTRNTTFSEQLPGNNLALYYYEVSAINHYIYSDAATSNKVMIGDPLPVPYSEDFSGNGFEQYEVIDANNDGKSWYEYNGEVLYMSSASRQADDWLVTPPIQLDADKIYELRAKVTGNEYNYETFDIAYGQGDDPTVYDMLVDETEISPRDHVKQVAQTVRVSKAGGYRFAFHVTSPAARYTISVDDIGVVVSSVFTAPDSVTNLKAVPAAEGAKGATVSFNAPARTIGGQALSSIDKIELSRAGEVIHTFTAPQPGEALSYDDLAAAWGSNKYSLRAWNAEGQGAEATATAYVGPDKPGVPRNVTLTDNFDGTATLTWQSPGAVGTNGGYVDEQNLTYAIYTINSSTGQVTLMKQGLTGTDYTVDGVETTGDQAALFYALRAVNDQGASDIVGSSTILTGAPYELPYSQSFAGAKVTDYWSVGATGQAVFGLTGSVSADDDEGAAAFQPAAPGESSSLSSGKISLANALKPKLVFSYYALPGSPATLAVEAWHNGSSCNRETLTTIDYAQLTDEPGWRTAEVDLSAWKSDRCVRLSFVATSYDTQVPVVFDAVRVTDNLDYNLNVRFYDLPATVKPGDTFTANVYVDNMGNLEAEEYEVTLYINGEAYGTIAGATLQPGETGLYTYDVKTNVATPATLTLKAVADYPADENPDNNTTPEATVKMDVPDYPVVPGLTATATDQGIELAWQQPDLASGSYTEGFESYEPFTITDLGDWTLYDGDGGQVGTIANHSFPNMGLPSAFIVMNPSASTDNLLGDRPESAPYEGNQYVMSFYSKTPPNDDWLISPVLDGRAQTISLMAKCWNSADYGNETFEVLASSTGTDVADFKRVAEYTTGVMQWTEFTADLPEGTKHFAIRVTSNDKYGIMFDNVTYAGGMFKLTGYNIYRNGELLTKVDADQLTYTDSEVNRGNVYRYNLTALYSVGESAASNTASALATSVGQATAASRLHVESLDGAIAVSGVRGEALTIYAADGRAVYSELCPSDRLVVKLSAGVYVVKADGKAVKALAR